MFYGAAVWDPLLIVSQIVSLQCLFYLSLGLLEALLLGPYVDKLTIVYLFHWQQLSLRSFSGWLSIFANLTNSFASALFLAWIVERAKKCLDFASTLYLLHLLLCSFISGFPASIEWWATNSLSLLIASLVGEWLCLRREMADIPVSTRGTAGSSSGVGGSSGNGPGGGGGGSSSGGAGGGGGGDVGNSGGGGGGSSSARATGVQMSQVGGVAKSTSTSARGVDLV